MTNNQKEAAAKPNGEMTGLTRAQGAFAKELLKARTMPNGAVLIDARQILIDLETEIMRISALTEELAEQGFVDPARLVFRYIEKLEAATTKMRTHQVIATAGALPAQR